MIITQIANIFILLGHFGVNYATRNGVNMSYGYNKQ